MSGTEAEIACTGCDFKIRWFNGQAETLTVSGSGAGQQFVVDGVTVHDCGAT